MTFTDDDLKRLKEDLARDRRIGLTSGFRFEALLARLEAAEAVLTFSDISITTVRERYEAWRKGAGK